jgi:hypothetical protein
MYAWNGVAPKKELKGQAAVVMDVLKEQNGELALASDIAEKVQKSGKLKTRQEVLRVTLYYIIVFKNAGLITTKEQDVDVPQEHDEMSTETVRA